MTRTNPIAAAPDALAALTELSSASAEGLPPALAQLVSLHVSQLNGCVYCTGLHRDGALAAGQPALKLEALARWADSPDFTPGERAALGLAEHLTRPSGGAVPEDVHAEAARHLGDAAAARVIWTVAAVNAWNRVGIATAAPLAGRRPAVQEGV
ncbi:carboxymuconolactone decarboxylase family protein [Streptomyces sp. NPDC021224]|uniref:carboxymuconolactone decarboxylase family protein n=1 Tax=unclassified Streptomyces TaxID=2593676 RepID=UPI0037B2724E